MQMRRFLAVFLAALAIVLVVAACGGGGSTGGTTGGNSTGSDGGAPTKAAFIKEADQVCGKAESELTKEVKEFAKKTTSRSAVKNRTQPSRRNSSSRSSCLTSASRVKISPR